MSQVEHHPRKRRSFWREYTLTDPDKPCPRCAYSLVGLHASASRCPECGWELTSAERLAEYRFLPIWESVRTICALPAACAMSMLLLLAVTFLTGVDLLILMVVIAGGCWLVSGAVTAFVLLAELVRWRRLRSGVQRREHLFRVWIAAVGLALVMFTPYILIVFTFGVLGDGR